MLWFNVRKLSYYRVSRVVKQLLREERIKQTVQPLYDKKRAAVAKENAGAASKYNEDVADWRVPDELATSVWRLVTGHENAKNSEARPEWPVSDKLLTQTEANYRLEAGKSGGAILAVVAILALFVLCLGAIIPTVDLTKGKWWWPPLVPLGGAVASGAAGVILIGMLDRHSRGLFFSDQWSTKWRRWVRRDRLAATDIDTIIFWNLSKVINRSLSELGNVSGSFIPHFNDTDASQERSLVVTDGLEQFRERLIRRPGLSVGLTGARGVGKTWALEYLRSFRSWIGVTVMVRLPVDAPPGDLPRFILRLTALEIGGKEPLKPLARQARAGGVFMIGGFLLAVLLAYLVASAAPCPAVVLPGDELTGYVQWCSILGTNWPLIASITMGLLLIIAIIGGVLLLLGASRDRGADHGRILARQIRDSLDFEETHSRGLSLGLAPQANGSISRTLSRKAMPILDAYTSFEDLVTAYHHKKRRVVLFIDELDRYPIDQLDAALNAIKPMLAVRGVSAVLAMSDQAEERWQKRTGGTIGVFDSSFDEVIHLPRWHLSDSEQLLNRVSIAVPPRMIAALHALAGGRPREIVRLARLAIQLKRFEVAHPNEGWPLELMELHPTGHADHPMLVDTASLTLLPPTDMKNFTSSSSPLHHHLRWEDCLDWVIAWLQTPAASTPTVDEVKRIHTEIATAAKPPNGQTWYSRADSTDWDGLARQVADLPHQISHHKQRLVGRLLHRRPRSNNG